MGNVVDLAFSSKELRQICESYQIAVRTLGPVIAARLKRRLADIDVATNAKELPTGQTTYFDSGEFAVELETSKMLGLCSNHAEQPRNKAGSIDWARVTRVKVIYIGERNG